MIGSSSVQREFLGSAEDVTDRDNLWQVTGRAMTIVNFRSKFYHSP
jgi:hypothetical protein